MLEPECLAGGRCLAERFLKSFQLGHKVWQPVAADWDALRNLCRLGGLRASDHRMVGSSDDHHQLIGFAGRGWLVRWYMVNAER